MWYSVWARLYTFTSGRRSIGQLAVFSKGGVGFSWMVADHSDTGRCFDDEASAVSGRGVGKTHGDRWMAHLWWRLDLEV